MKGKKKNRKKVGKIILLAMSFVMTVVLTFTITLAWFYDSDWANNTVTMAGAVGIEMRDTAGNATHGAGNFYFELSNSTHAYPGQAIDIQASVFNDGGSSIINHFDGKTYNNSGSYNSSSNYNDADIQNAGTQKVGSPCYIRARFVVYTDIGPEYTGAELDSKYPVRTEPTAPGANATNAELQAYYAKLVQYQEYKEYLDNRIMSAQELYSSLVDMILATNDHTKSAGYNWIFWENTSPTVNLDNKDYFEGKQQTTTGKDGGYFYLCYDTDDASKNIKSDKTLKPLNVGQNSAFLWDGTFVIPWQLTNLSADRTIFVAVEFQAIQTFIPLITVTGGKGTISGNKDNQLPEGYCYYNDISVQTIFNTSRFTNFEELTTGSDGRVYSKDPSFVRASYPVDAVYSSGTAQPNAYTIP